ncbi:WD40-repeat-containing domain protein, partial [Haematococcus lacustris]
MVPAPIAPGWQHPFVDVLKLCDRETELKGEVTEHMDKIIGKKVYKVRGTIPAANYLRLPKLKAQNLGLTGRFLYIQVKVTPVKVFVIHLEVQTQDQNVHRISISSMYRTESLQRKSNGIQIPFTQSSHRWCIMAVDLVTALRKYTTSPLSCLRSAQLCSWLTLRALFTSDLKFSLQTLPRDMALSHALDSSLFEFVWLPQEPLDVGCADIMPVSRRVTADKRPSSSSSAGGGGHGPAPGLCPPPHSPPAASHGLPPAFTMSATAGLMSDAAQALALQLQDTAALASVPAAVPGPHNSTGANMRQQVLPPQRAWSETWPSPLAPSAGQGGGAPGAGPPLPGKADRPALLKGRQQVGARPGGAVQGLLLEPDTALTLVRVNAFQGEFARSLVWPPHSDELVFTASSVIVAMAAQAGGAQRFFLGHTAPVVALAFDGEGRLMASAQDGRQAVIRVWDFRSRQCLAILNGHASGMLGLDVSADGRALLGVGQDSACRQLMVLWDISHLRFGGKPTVLAQATTEYNIKVARFSAYEEDHLVTAGRDNVRMYRLKAGQLRGVTVRTGAPSKQVTTYKGVISAALGPNIFTDIAFESSAGVYSLDNRHVFVSSASGSVFEIDYNSRTLLCVYQLHSAAINSIIVHDGFCVTGSDDKQLRVWPMNFSDFLLEAEHEAGVTSVSVAHDGLRVAIGTESGALGVLDIPSHAFTTLLRSHTGNVNAVAADPCRPEYCTVSSDGTIRIWDLATHQQLVEFDAPGEVVTCVAYHPRQQELATGFANGRVRVFDVASTTLLQASEHLQHRAEVLQVAYSPDGSRLYSAGADGGLCVFDVAQVYAPIKFLSAGKRDVRVCLAVSNDGRYIATVSQDASRGITSLLLFHGSTLEPYMRIETDGTIVRRLAFSPDGSELWVLADTTRLDRYELVEGQLLQQVDEAHRLDINSLAVDPGARFLATAGNDGLVKLWAVVPRTADVGLLQGVVPDHQAFSGHPSAVLDCTLAHDHLVTVGEGESVFI